jgi:hypothetical protein
MLTALGHILGKDSLSTFGCIPQHFESASADILSYIKTLIYLYFIYVEAVLKCETLPGKIRLEGPGTSVLLGHGVSVVRPH